MISSLNLACDSFLSYNLTCFFSNLCLDMNYILSSLCLLLNAEQWVERSEAYDLRSSLEESHPQAHYQAKLEPHSCRE